MFPVDDCSHFGIKEPEFDQYDEVAKDLEKHEIMWGMFEEFNNEMEGMTGEEWIVFRSKMYKFEDFLSNWSKKLQSQEKATTVTVKLIFEDGAPCLEPCQRVPPLSVGRLALQPRSLRHRDKLG